MAPRFHILMPLVLLAVALASAAVMSCAPRTSWAQTQLTLAHLNPDNDLELDFAAVVVSGGSANSGASNLYAAGGWGTAGSIAEGDLNFGSGGGSFTRVRTTNDNSQLRLNGPQSGAAVDLQTVFNGGGERSGWSFYVMASAGGDRMELGSFSAGSSNAMNVNLTSEMTSGQLTAWRAVRSGHRFILALGRANNQPTHDQQRDHQRRYQRVGHLEYDDHQRRLGPGDAALPVPGFRRAPVDFGRNVHDAGNDHDEGADRPFSRKNLRGRGVGHFGLRAGQHHPDQLQHRRGPVIQPECLHQEHPRERGGRHPGGGSHKGVRPGARP